MDRPRTHYEVLGVPSGADLPEIRRAYVRLARQFHPDAHAGRSAAERSHAERRMRDVNVAWSVLSDRDKRQAYDEASVRARPSAPSRPRPSGPGWRPLPDDDAWLDDFGSWRAETDMLPPDPPGPRQPVRMLPAAVFALGAVVGLLGLVMGSNPLIAAAASLMLISLSLFVWLPLAELARSRRDDLDP